MPEGDTTFRAARTLHAALAGRVVTRFETVLPRLARVDDDAPIAGRTVEAVAAQGKHQLLRLSARPGAEGAAGAAGALVLRTHQRMSGSWHLYRPGERWQRPRGAMRVLLATEAHVAVGFDVPVAELVPAAALARDGALRRLGPDLLASGFDAAEALRRLRARGPAAIADALLDQSALAGVGNVFKSEILFVAGVSPFRAVASLADEDLARIVEQARRLLRANVGPGKGDGIATWSGGRRTTGRADPAQRLWVYSRGGDPCRRCGTPVASARRGRDARVTYWCPRCQPEP